MFYEEEKKVFRCSKCLKIPLIGLIYENEGLYIEYYCLSKHDKQEYTKLEYEIFKKTFQEILTKKKCDCGKFFDGKPFYFCCNCPKENQFYCDANSRIHRRNEKNHILIPLEKFDISCECHNDEFISFCNECKLNLCIKEKKKHSKHIMEDIIRLNVEEVNNYENKIKELKKNFETFKNYLEKLEKQLSMVNENAFKKTYLNNIEKEIDFIETILNIYKMKTKQNNLNYQIIQNVKNILKFKNNFRFPMIDYDDDDDDIIFDIQCQLEDFYQNIKQNSPIEFSPLTH